VKGAEARFARSIEDLMNEMAAEGWSYQRADILPSTERAGLASSQTVYRSVLVFRRPHRPGAALAAEEAALAEEDVAEEDLTDPGDAPDPEAPDDPDETAPDEDPARTP